MKVLFIKGEFEIGDCTFCPLTQLSLSECAYDEHCPLHEVVEIYNKASVDKTMLAVTDRKYFNNVLNSHNIRNIANEIYNKGLYTISSETDSESGLYETEMTVMVVDPHEYDISAYEEDEI